MKWRRKKWRRYNIEKIWKGKEIQMETIWNGEDIKWRRYEMEEIWNWEDRKLWNCNGERKMEKICRCASQDLCIWSVWGIWLNRIFFPETTNFPSHVRNMSWVSMVRYIHFLVKLTCFPGASKHLIWYIGNFKHFGHSKYVHSKIKRYVSKMTLHTFSIASN